MAIILNDNLKINVGKPIDTKYLNGLVPYVNTAEVISVVPIGERYIGLTVNVVNVEYWFETGVADIDLVLKATPPSSDRYVSGATLTGSSVLTLARTEGLPNLTVDLSTLEDVYVSGVTLTGSSVLTLARTEGLPNLTVDLSTLSDGVVSGVSLTGSTVLTLARTEGLPNLTVDLSSLSDGVVSGGTLNGSAILALERTEGLGNVNIDLSALSGGTGGGDQYTGDTPSTVEVGGLLAGSILTGRSYTDIFEEMLVVYLPPTFSAAPTVTPQPLTVEVGTTLSGTRTFSWSTTNSGNVSANTITIRDVTGAVDLAINLADDGSELTGITTLQLATNNATQQWRMEGVNTNSTPFNSSNRTVTAKFYRFYGANATTPVNSAQVRALPTSAFQTSNVNVFNLATGSVLTKFVVALPPSRTITNVIDLDALNADITSSYVLQGTVSVLDDGGAGASQTYNLYEMNLGAPYAATHNHQITTL